MSLSRISAPVADPNQINLEKRATLVSNFETNLDEEESDFELKAIIRSIPYRRVYDDDWKDHSENPSFTQFEIPYHMKCQNRYLHKKKEYERQFQREIGKLVEAQGSAYEAVRLTRHLAITSMWPPLHSHREIRHTQSHFFAMTPKERHRYNLIMNTTFN